MDWDNYFVEIAVAVSKKSHCLSIQRGAILVRDRKILSTGYNGPPVGMVHCEMRDDKGNYPTESNVLNAKDTYECPRRRMGFQSGAGLEFCPAVHSEQNAIIQAAKHGISVDGSTIYCNFNQIPCRECSKLIVNAGIKEIVLAGTPESYHQYGIQGSDILAYSGVIVRGLKENTK